MHVRQFGAIIFSPCLASVLLVKKDADSSWSFPTGPSEESVHAVAAAAIVKKLLGIDVSESLNAHHWVEAEPSEGHLVKLFIASNVSPEQSLQLDSIAASSWISWQDILSSTDDSYQLLVPFMPRLQLLLARHPELRTTEVDQELVSLLDYRSSSWEGAKPCDHLAEYCRFNELPEPCYSPIFKKTANRSFSTASCILPHLGVQITPEYNRSSKEDAEQLAALYAILYLEGCFDVYSDHCRVVPVGYPPLSRPEHLRSFGANLERKNKWMSQQKEALMQRLDQKRQKLAQELAELERTQAALQAGALPVVAAPKALMASISMDGPLAGTLATAPSWGAASSGTGRGGRPAKRPRTNVAQPAGGSAGGGGGGAAAAPAALGAAPAGAVAPGEGGSGKNVVQELKEMCDQKKWAQPLYDYTKDVGGYMCTVQLPQAGLHDLCTKLEPNKKKAKETAAAMVLQQLRELGLR